MRALADTLDLACRRGHWIADSYLIGDVLGIGGMGVVYAAVQRSLDRTVALKLPRAELLGDPTVRRRLRSEALAGSQINHPNIVRVLDYGRDHGLPFVVMEHVAGPRLGQLLGENGPLPVHTAMLIVRQVVAGLEEAHARGIVHADLKCDNVLIETLRNAALTPRIIDFGIARFVGEPSFDAAESVVTGTPEYLAPEVICGGLPGFAADVYAVGVMLYELVTGATPFASSSSAQVMTRCIEDDPVPIRLRCPDRDIPEEFDALVMRALSRDLAARYRDASMLGRALDAIMPMTESVHESPPEAASIFSTEAITATMSMDVRPSEPIAVGSARQSQHADAALTAAVTAGDASQIIVACLANVRALVDEHRLGAAIGEIEAAITLVSQRCAGAPLWRLQLTLAALFDGIGDRARARSEARSARDEALRCCSATGCERADRLLSRLAYWRASSRS